MAYNGVTEAPMADIRVANIRLGFWFFFVSLAASGITPYDLSLELCFYFFLFWGGIGLEWNEEKMGKQV
jgi:hypothetical protein